MILVLPDLLDGGNPATDQIAARTKFSTLPEPPLQSTACPPFQASELHAKVKVAS
jgi:hypothetical protein